ncbi:MULTISPECIES: TraQ conjugal transfer family protein [Chryseobacterium]|uniref:TraQ conjugal transfer family protein n=1 Tax=Chryseobacterium TaxID=59732 RepID=UPI001D011A2F|nr:MULTISPECIES: TraQ conjugal transfer family protein [Chryseobacterium]
MLQKSNLRFFNNPTMQPNDLYPLHEKEFRLYYTSESTVSKNVILVIKNDQ